MDRRRKRVDSVAHQTDRMGSDVLMDVLRDKLEGKAGQMRRVFRTFDVNKDGTVSYDEFHRGAQPPSRAPRAAVPRSRRARAASWQRCTP